ncbi:helix-turn-helix transcriptional regulator [Staphylococcus aureus]|nr:helix-turn-helix transcriptional regulator [Staphylococcus aureus]MDM5860549.1 helix-turn-helix transcriptional regulator [Staphylococcus aureus]
MLKVSRQSVSKWESAKNYPSLDILIAMSDLFGITLDHLIKG